MKTNNSCLVVFLAISALLFSACSNSSPTTPEIIPKTKYIKVDYVRVPPIPNPNGKDTATLSLSWLSGAIPEYRTLEMVKVAEDSFTISGVEIMTETVIWLCVFDDRMLSGTENRVCKTIKIDGKEILTGSTIYFLLAFIYKNDGTIISDFPGGL